MNDDVKAAVDELRDAVKLDRQRCGDDMAESLWKSELLILAHIDGEPARIAAAREEQRASDAEQLARIWYGLPNAGRADHGPVAVVRSTPLTATPLADALRLANENIVKMAQASTEAQASAAEGVRYWTDLAQAEARDAAALRARVAELEAEREGMLMGGVTTEARAQLERAEKAEAERDARFDCKGGPGTTSPACGGCATCLHRVIEGVEAERDALRARVFEVEQRQVGYVLVSFASHEQWKAELVELGALRARLDALYGVTLFAHAFAEAEPLVSGYVRLHGHILHLREIHALARAATQAMDEAKP